MSSYDFSNKSCILDTNVLNALTGAGKGSEKFRPVFEFLREKDARFFILEGTKFEFVGYSSSKKEYDKLEEWITSFPNMLIDHITSRDFELATRLSSMYKCKNPSISPKQISFVDCLHAAMLCRYKERAFIVTTDLNDYPSFLFDMPFHISIEEEGGATFFVGFKTFNQTKWNVLSEGFERSG